jgi:hypothetical protein
MTTSQFVSMHEAAAVAYAIARREVYDKPGWTPTMPLTGHQVAILAVLADAEAQVHHAARRSRTANASVSFGTVEAFARS